MAQYQYAGYRLINLINRNLVLLTCAQVDHPKRPAIWKDD